MASEQEASLQVMKVFRSVVFSGSAFLAHKAYGLPLTDFGTQERIEAACKRALAAAAADKSLSASDREAAAIVAAMPYPTAAVTPMSDGISVWLPYLKAQAEVAAPWFFSPIPKFIDLMTWMPMD
jgi:hypothetical protein